MKKIIIPISALFVTGLIHAQLTPTENYVYTKTYLEDPALPTPKTSETVQYVDGLGRSKQVVNIKASPQGKDVVSYIEYDQFGRQTKDYLPIPQSGTQNGAIYPTPLSNAPSVYGAEKIYSEKILESSPLDRIQQQVQAGNDWSTKPVKFDYATNTAGDYVRKYQTNTTWDTANNMMVTSVQLLQYFGPSQLYKNTVTDEDGNKTIEFKNSEGQIILVRKVLSPTENADTYYVYNEYDLLAYVIPPSASAQTVESDTVEKLYYQYRYDGRKRLVEKKLPGKGWEYMVYDKADRLVMTQDAVMKPAGKWLFTKYDRFSRIVYTGITDIGAWFSRSQVQASVDYYIGQGQPSVEGRNQTGFANSGMTVYYDNIVYPTATDKVLTVNYYDTYPQGTPAVTNVFSQDVLTDNYSNAVSTKGLPTASYIKNIEDNNWTKIYNWYDTKGRNIGSRSDNHLGGYTVINNKLDFTGTVLQTNTYHKRLAGDTEISMGEVFEYDNQNRLKKNWHYFGNNGELLAENTYNELSQLVNKKVGNNLQSIDYAYNIRGWMTQINDPAVLNGKLFGYKIKYTNPESGIYPGRFNGNIAEIDWKTAADGQRRRYNYLYDPLNRLEHAVYLKPDASVVQTSAYNEWMQYDLNGNITRLDRYGDSDGNSPIQIDQLYYTYSGNRLTSVTDTTQNPSGYPGGGNTIEYDLNGNMTSHLDKGISSIAYNFLNLPNVISQNRIYSYVYGADGRKLQKKNKKLNVTITTDYLDGFQYEFNSAYPQFSGLQFVPTSEGYFDFQKNKYIYNYTDHLGNVRVSYFNNGTGAEVLEENNYYPFGLKHEGYNVLTGNSAYKYKYNGKELQETGMYDYGARFYMPDIGRWGVVDPLAEKSRRFSPYNYAVNNPIRFIDPDGRSEQDWVKRTGQSGWEYRSDITSAQQASNAGYVSYADGRGDAKSTYTTPMSSNGIDTGVDREVVLGEGGNYTVDGKAFIAEDQAPYVSSSEVDKLGKALSAQLYVPAFIMSGGTGSAIGDYLIESGTRGLTDFSTQAYFKGAENVDGKQLLINTFVGGGGSYQGQAFVAGTNLLLNTTNNVFGSGYDSRDNSINAVKVMTGALGNAAGVVGGNILTGTILPSVYMNGTDKILNDANEKYKNGH